MRLLLSSAILATLYLCLPCATLAAEDAAAISASTKPPATDAARFNAEVSQKPNLLNFHEVHPYLYRSGAPDEVGLQQAKANGVTTVLDLRNAGEIKKKGDEELWAKRLGLKYINMPMGPQAPTKSQVSRFLKLVDQAQKNKSAVLVHCSHGSDRTGCLVGIWRVKRDHWSYDKAYEEMRHYWFSPKFTQLSGAVKEYSRSAP